MAGIGEITYIAVHVHIDSVHTACRLVISESVRNLNAHAAGAKTGNISRAVCIGRLEVIDRAVAKGCPSSCGQTGDVRQLGSGELHVGICLSVDFRYGVQIQHNSNIRRVNHHCKGVYLFGNQLFLCSFWQIDSTGARVCITGAHIKLNGDAVLRCAVLFRVLFALLNSVVYYTVGNRYDRVAAAIHRCSHIDLFCSGYSRFI